MRTVPLTGKLQLKKKCLFLLDFGFGQRMGYIEESSSLQTLGTGMVKRGKKKMNLR
jgi:hypothetical protein